MLPLAQVGDTVDLAWSMKNEHPQLELFGIRFKPDQNYLRPPYDTKTAFTARGKVLCRAEVVGTKGDGSTVVHLAVAVAAAEGEEEPDVQTFSDTGRFTLLPLVAVDDTVEYTFTRNEYGHICLINFGIVFEG